MPASFRHHLRAAGKGINSQPATWTAKQAPEARENTWAKMMMVPVGNERSAVKWSGIQGTGGHQQYPLDWVADNVRCQECKGRRHEPCLQGVYSSQRTIAQLMITCYMTSALARVSPGCYEERLWWVGVQKKGTGMLFGRDEVDLSLAGWEGSVWERKSRKKFSGRGTCLSRRSKVQESILTNVLYVLFFMACILFY